MKAHIGSQGPPLAYRGRSIGIVLLVAAQLLIGAIHVFFGVWLLSASQNFPLVEGFIASDAYSVYTVVFGLLTLVFTGGIWIAKSWGWIGTIAVSLFVIVADSLTLLDLPSVPGIPKFAGATEIIYSVLIVVYLSQRRIRARYGLSR